MYSLLLVKYDFIMPLICFFLLYLMSVTVAFKLTGINYAGSTFRQNLATDQSYRAKKNIFRPRREHVPAS